MLSSVSFILDGRLTTVDFGPGSGLSPTTTVLQYLRSDPRHRGVKEGCAEGDCGACTVVLAREEEGGLVYEAVDSCLLFLPMLHRRQLITVENLRGPDGRLHPVQQAMVDAFGSQCGFCTPGIVMSLFALCKESASRGEDHLRSALAGNLCRCTGYRPILDAARSVCAARTADHFAAEEQNTLAMLGAIPHGNITILSGSGCYHRPAAWERALSLRGEHPDAIVLNGATDVALRVTKLHESLPLILDLSGVGEIRDIRVTPRGSFLGSGLTVSQAEEHARTHLRWLSPVLETFGSRQIRNTATLGGNIATASPVGDLLPMLMASEASIHLEESGAAREVPASEFVIGYRKTACRARELIRGVAIARLPAGSVVRWYKLSRRSDVDIATVSAAFRLDLDGSGRVAHIVLAYGGMAARTERARRTEDCLRGKPW
ncbi:MAG: FAD binding domain-containing protein, partial [Bacteroidota bacterium]